MKPSFVILKWIKKLPQPKFGITTRSLTDKHYYYLISSGSSSAKVVLEHRYKLDPVQKMKISNHVSKVESRGIKFNSHYSEIDVFLVMAALITPKKKCIKLPLKALVNPYLNKALNDKLSMLFWKDTLEDYEYRIRTNTSGGIAFGYFSLTSADIRNIRFAIVWLNHTITFPRPLENPTMLITKKEYLTFIESGFDGLKAIANRNKVALRNLFSSLNELESASFFSSASMEFAEIWFEKFTESDRYKFIKANEYVYFSNQKHYENYPIYYLYNKGINLNINKIKWLYEIGYTTMKDISFVSEENKILLEDKAVWHLLHQSFGNHH